MQDKNETHNKYPRIIFLFPLWKSGGNAKEPKVLLISFIYLTSEFQNAPQKQFYSFLTTALAFLAYGACSSLSPWMSLKASALTFRLFPDKNSFLLFSTKRKNKNKTKQKTPLNSHRIRFHVMIKIRMSIWVKVSPLVQHWRAAGAGGRPAKGPGRLSLLRSASSASSASLHPNQDMSPTGQRWKTWPDKKSPIWPALI